MVWGGIQGRQPGGRPQTWLHPHLGLGGPSDTSLYSRHIQTTQGLHPEQPRWKHFTSHIRKLNQENTAPVAQEPRPQGNGKRSASTSAPGQGGRASPQASSGGLSASLRREWDTFLHLSPDTKKDVISHEAYPHLYAIPSNPLLLDQLLLGQAGASGLLKPCFPGQPCRAWFLYVAGAALLARCPQERVSNSPQAPRAGSPDSQF